jgi:antitoxin CptB
MTDMELRRRRALYRAQHRGTKEMDIVIGRYAEASLGAMDAAGLDLFEEFLALPDPMLQGWVLAGDGTAPPAFQALVARVRAHHGLNDGTQGLDGQAAR